eukprot:9325837-Pyramimonas_sp.AAC.3
MWDTGVYLDPRMKRGSTWRIWMGFSHRHHRRRHRAQRMAAFPRAGPTSARAIGPLVVKQTPDPGNPPMPPAPVRAETKTETDLPAGRTPRTPALERASKHASWQPARWGSPSKGRSFRSDRAAGPRRFASTAAEGGGWAQHLTRRGSP